MGNWIGFGPIAVRVGSRNLAKWGYARLRIGGLSLWTRSNDGSLILASYHPRKSPTWWWWSVSLTRRQPDLKRVLCFTEKRCRQGQWDDYVKLPFGWALGVSRQDYHRRLPTL